MKKKCALHLQSVLMTIGVVGMLLSGYSLAYASNITMEVITWDVIGLDSNDPATGPYQFPVGVRVCNESGGDVDNIVATFNWDDTNSTTTDIALRADSLTFHNIGTLTDTECRDVYYEVEVDRAVAPYDLARGYYVEVTSDAGTFRTDDSATLDGSGDPNHSRELFVEHLISQNRNAVWSVEVDGTELPNGGTATLMVGETYEITVNGQTAIQGYEQLEQFLSLPSTVFQIDAVTTEYSAPGYVMFDGLYGDACDWDADVDSPSYLSCLDAGTKNGGTVRTIYTVTILQAPPPGPNNPEPIHVMIYDFSGSSFHYNADYASVRYLEIGSMPTMDKAFSPTPIAPGGTSVMTLTVNNANTGAISDVNFIDNLPLWTTEQMVIADPLSYTTSGCGTPTVTRADGATALLAGDADLKVADITVAGKSACTIKINVTAPTVSLFPHYVNDTENLFVGTTDTLDDATATLEVVDDPPPACTPGATTLASWVVETGDTPAQAVVPDYTRDNPINASYVGSGTESVGVFEDTRPAWGAHLNWDLQTGPNAGASPYFEFVADTSNVTGAVQITFEFEMDVNWAAAADNHMYVYSNADGGAFVIRSNTSNLNKDNSFVYSHTVTASSVGALTTAFRINAIGAGGSGGILLNNIVISECGVPEPPEIIKEFVPDEMYLGEAVTPTLTFTVTNPNDLAMLSGVSVVDNLPANVTLATIPNTNCPSSTASGVVDGSTITLTGGVFEPSTFDVTLGSREALGASGAAAASGVVVGSVIRFNGVGPYYTVANIKSTGASDTLTFTDTYSGATQVGLNFYFGLAPGATCTITTTVNGLAVGAHLNVSEHISATESGTNHTSTGFATDTLNVLTGPVIAKQFNPDTIAEGGRSLLMLTISNPNADATLTGLAFLDNFPGDVTIKEIVPASPDADPLTVDPEDNSCGGRFVDNSAASLNVGDTGVQLIGTYSGTVSVTTANNIVTGAGTSFITQATVGAVVVIDSVAYTVTQIDSDAQLQLDSIPAAVAAGVTMSNGLAAGASCTLSVYVTSSTVGTHTNTTGTVSSTNGGTGNTAEDELFVEAAVPGLNILKQVGPTAAGPWTSYMTINAGNPAVYPQDVFFRFVVENTGETQLTNVSVVEETVPALNPLADCVAELAAGPVVGGLALYETVTCESGLYQINSGGQYQNTAHATSAEVTSDSSTVDYATTQLTLDKQVVSGSPFTAALQTIGYQYVITNTGYAPLTSIGLTDDKIVPGDISCPALTTVGDLDNWLDRNEKIICTGTYETTAADVTATEVVNIASATGTDSLSNIITSNPDTETVPLGAAGDIDLSIVKVPNSFTPNIGDTITWTLTVTNSSLNDASGVVVKDYVPVGYSGITNITAGGTESGGTITWNVGAILAGASAILEFDVTVADSPGNYTNQAQITNATENDIDSVPADKGANPDDFSYDEDNADGDSNTATGGLDDDETEVGLTPTYASVSSFAAYIGKKNRTVLQWETESENGTLGYRVERLNERTGEYEPVNKKIIPAMQIGPSGGIYKLVDRRAQAGREHTYRIIEEAFNLGGGTFGPYTVRAEQPLPEKQSVTLDKMDDFSIAVKSSTVKERKRSVARQKMQNKRASRRKQQAGDTVKIPVSSDGLVSLTANELADASGLTARQVQRYLRKNRNKLTLNGEDVSVLKKNRGKALQFYGKAPERNDVGENIYLLELGEKGAAMENAPGRPEQVVDYTQSYTGSVQVEENYFSVHMYLTDEFQASDNWVQDFLLGGFGYGYDTVTQTLDTAYATGVGIATVTIDLLSLKYKGSGDGAPYKVSVSLNGIHIGTDEWSENGDHQFLAEVSADLLEEDGNEVKIDAQLNAGFTSSNIYLEAIKIEYDRTYEVADGELSFSAADHDAVTVQGLSSEKAIVFDITDPNAQQSVQTLATEDGQGGFSITVATEPGHQYFLSENIETSVAGELAADSSSDLRNTENKADYLIICPAELMDAALTLAEHREGQGMVTMVVDIEDVQDEFSNSQAAPEAVHDFLAYVYSEWERVPLYVGLIGEGFYDYNNYLGEGSPAVPSQLVATSVGSFTTDNQLADVVGEDGVPEFAVGRIPVADEEELKTYINKLIAYEGSLGGRSTELTLVTDLADPGAGSFTNSADLVTSLVPADYPVTRLSADSGGIGDTRNRIVSSLQDNSTGVLHYIGHSPRTSFGKSSSLFKKQDIEGLSALGAPVLMVSMSCSVADFGYPIDQSIGEVALLKENSAAVVFLGATGISYNSHADVLAQGFYSGIFDAENTRVGEALLDAKQHYHQQGQPEYILHAYNLLGDPAALIPVNR